MEKLDFKEALTLFLNGVKKEEIINYMNSINEEIEKSTTVEEIKDEKPAEKNEEVDYKALYEQTVSELEISQQKLKEAQYDNVGKQQKEEHVVGTTLSDVSDIFKKFN